MAAARSRDLPRGPHFFPPPSTTGMPPRAARPTRRPFASASPSSAACPSAPRGQPSLGIAVDAFAEQSTLPITCRCELAGRSSELRTCEHEARLARLAARDDRRRRLCSLRLRRRRLRLRSCCRRCSLLLLVVVHDCTARASLDCLRRRHHRVDRHRFRVCRLEQREPQRLISLFVAASFVLGFAVLFWVPPLQLASSLSLSFFFLSTPRF